MRLALQTLALTIALASGTAARADPPVPEMEASSDFQASTYLVAMLGTTLAYRPHGGDLFGPQEDVSPMAGMGVLLSPELAVELDLGPTMVSGDYVSFSAVPGVVWLFTPHAYVAGRLLVVIDPEPNLGLLPGLGLIHAFDNGVAPFLEVNLLSNVGRGEPDLGVVLALGAVYTP
jgi:hypothetical protein